MYLSIAQGHDGLPCVIDAVTGEVVGGVQKLSVSRDIFKGGRKFAYATIKVLIKDREWAKLSAQHDGLKRIDSVFYQFGQHGQTNLWQGGSELVTQQLPDTRALDRSDEFMTLERHSLNEHISRIEVGDILNFDQTLIGQQLTMDGHDFFCEIICNDASLHGFSSLHVAAMCDSEGDRLHQFEINTHQRFNSSDNPTLLQDHAEIKVRDHSKKVGQYTELRRAFMRGRMAKYDCRLAELAGEFDPIRMGM